mgnify:CR=1 FL=1
MRNFILLLILIPMILSCGKNNNSGSNKHKEINYIKAYTPCRDSLSGYCSRVTFTVYGSAPMTFTCPVSNFYMSTGKEAVIKKHYNSWTGRWFYGCDSRRNLEEE